MIQLQTQKRQTRAITWHYKHRLPTAIYSCACLCNGWDCCSVQTGFLPLHDPIESFSWCPPRTLRCSKALGYTAQPALGAWHIPWKMTGMSFSHTFPYVSLRIPWMLFSIPAPDMPAVLQAVQWIQILKNVKILGGNQQDLHLHTLSN